MINSYKEAIMDNFCKYCGNTLEENETCTCPEALLEQEQLEKEKVSETVDSIIVEDNQADLPEEPVSLDKPEEPKEESKEEKTGFMDKMKQKAEGKKDEMEEKRQEKKQEKDAEKELKAQEKEQLKEDKKREAEERPTKAEQLPIFTSVIFVLIQALSGMLFSVVIHQKLLQIKPSPVVGFILPFSIVLLGLAIQFGLLYVLSRVFQGHVTPKGTLGIVALSAIPWIVGTIVMSIGLLLIGDKFNILLPLFIFIISFASTFSILIIDRSLMSKLKNSGVRIIIISFTLAIQVTLCVVLFLFAVAKYTGTNTADLLNQLGQIMLK